VSIAEGVSPEATVREQRVRWSDGILLSPIFQRVCKIINITVRCYANREIRM